MHPDVRLLEVEPTVLDEAYSTLRRAHVSHDHTAGNRGGPLHLRSALFAGADS